MKFAPIITPGYLKRRNMSEQSAPADELLAAKGDYCGLKFVQGRKVAQVIIEIPIEHANAFVNAFGTPDSANPVKVALARMMVPR